ncbi:MlaD family protein [Novispirillum itersonii]|uniref:MlaD family protein n=1 Tax=Novispirillum itersonii TaxID=189 RepID=UPI00035F10F8|nr:MlaD family protein [Novispirillum itersonii]
MTRSHSPRPALTDMRETLIGALVLGVLAVVLALNAADKGQDEHIDGYVLSASFQRTDGITIGAPVRLAGLRVGEVIGQSLVDGFRAELTMRVNSGVEIPVDSAAVIETDGLLGPKYIEIHPGGEDDVLAPGTRFEYAQDAMVLEDLLSRIVEQARQKALERAGAVGGPAASPADGDDGDDAPPGAVPPGAAPPGAAGGVPGLVPSLRDLLNNRTEDGDKALEHLPDITPNGVLPAPDPRPGQSGGQSGGQTGNRSSQNGQSGFLPPGQRPAATAASLTVPAPR